MKQAAQTAMISRKRTALILIVDDDVNLCRMVYKILSASGYACQSVFDVLQAERALNENKFNLILCDITLPGRSGIDLLASVNARFPEIAIVMMTGNDSPETAQLAFRVGAAGYLLKPFFKNELLIQVAGALHRRALEMENLFYREELEQIVSQRTAELEKTNAALKSREKVLNKQAKELKDMNTTLEVLLKNSERLRDELQNNFSANVQTVIYPYFRKMAAAGLSNKQKLLLELIEAALTDMVSPMMNRLTTLHAGLTLAETEVAQLIKQGKSTKQIAEILAVSINTILTHRFKIRKKMGLIGHSESLYSALHAISSSDV